MYLTQWKKNYVFWFLYICEGYVEDLKQLLFTLTKPVMTEVYSRYSAKAPEPLSAQFNDRMDKQSAVKAYKEKCGKRTNIQLFPTGIFLSRFRCCFAFIFASHNSLLANLLKYAIPFTFCSFPVYIIDQPLCFQGSLSARNVLNLYHSISFKKEKTRDDRSQVINNLTNKFV